MTDSKLAELNKYRVKDSLKTLKEGIAKVTRSASVLEQVDNKVCIRLTERIEDLNEHLDNIHTRIEEYSENVKETPASAPNTKAIT